VPPELTQRFRDAENLVGDRQYVQQLSDITAMVKDTQVQPTIKSDDRFTTVTVPTNGATEIVMSYTVTVQSSPSRQGTALRWGMLQGLSASVAEFSATVQIPTQFSYIKCTCWQPELNVPCNFAAAGTEEAQVPTFRDGPRGEGEVVIDRHRLSTRCRGVERGDRYRWTSARFLG
jgi:hypothetical protein